MKTCIKNLFHLPALVAGLGLILAGRVTAQTFTTLHSFISVSDGASSYAGLITDLSGNTLYGTTGYGGGSGQGTVFKVNTDGTGFTNLHSFTATACDGCPNSDGASPGGGLILSGNTLYGTAYFGGSSGKGTVFRVNIDGTGFTNLNSFNGDSDGANLQAGLILSSNTLYGTARYGGSFNDGTVFAVNTDGTGFTNLHSFAAGSADPAYTNSDGAYPQAGLSLSGNTLYGTADHGGSAGAGTVFAVNTDGTSFTNLHSFTAGTTNSSGVKTNSDGATPVAGLILSGNTLYGTAHNGGSSGQGTVFAVNTDGTGFTNLHTFTGISDGANPAAGLFLSGNTLYGTAKRGGGSGAGTLFAVNTEGTGFTNLHSFTALSGTYPYTNSDGATPEGGLVLSGNTLYGTAFIGGSSGNGTVFSLSFPPPQLTIAPSGSNVIMTWPTSTPGFSYAGYTLQSTINLVSPADWITVSPGPVLLNGLNTVTNSASGTQKFYRLRQGTQPCLGPSPGPEYICVDGVWTHNGTGRL